MTSVPKVSEGGYGWVVVFSSCIAQTLEFGIIWTMGVFYQVFKEQFDESSATIAVITALLTACYYSAGAIAGVLTNKYGHRKVTITGGLVGNIGLVISSFSTEVYHLYIAFSVLAGLGYGIAYVPSVTVVVEYFNKKRIFAMGLAVSGVALGSLLFPFVIRALEAEFGWRGAMYILGAIGLNLCVCGALFRPVIKPVTSNDEKKPDAKGLLNLTIFKMMPFLIYCLNQVLWTLGFFVVYTHLPYYAITVGVTVTESTILISVIGLLNLIGRFTMGLIANNPCVNPLLFFITSFVLAGLIIIPMGLIQNLGVLITLAGLMGWFTAAWGVLGPEIIVLSVSNDPSLLSSAFGYHLVFNAIGALLGPPVAGWLYDLTHNYSNSFYLAGASCVASGLVMFIPWNQLQKSKQQHWIITWIVNIVNSRRNSKDQSRRNSQVNSRRNSKVDIRRNSKDESRRNSMVEEDIYSFPIKLDLNWI